jgi:predicted regulator of Ras-like GTPase activity (Roadblock/LC7/MglB family)
MRALALGAVAESSVTGSDGQIFVYSAGTKGVLAVIAPKGGNAGLVHLEARQVAKDIGDLFEKRSPAPGDARGATPSA